MISAFLSSFSLALMTIIDKLMIKDYYRGEARHAWFVSTAAGVVFGLSATLLYWAFSAAPIPELFSLAVNLFVPYGLFILLAGSLSAQALYHYFYCFSIGADSTVIASWLATAPISVFLTTWLLSVFGFWYHDTPFSLWLFTGVFVASAGLTLLERYSYGTEGAVRGHATHLALMLAFNTISIVVIDITLEVGAAAENADITAFTLATLPFYWLGFGAGTRVVFLREERAHLKSLVKRIRPFLLPIAVVEIVGMFVFFFEFLGLSVGDPTLVSLIVSAHVLLVWVAAKSIVFYGTHLRNASGQAILPFGIPFSAETLAEFQTLRGTLFFQLACISAVVLGITLFTCAR